MRIIAGKHRGRVLKEFKGREVRPTADRAKEAIFNILQTEIRGSSFLDLFCGTGNMGIEAISRGAAKVVMVDLSKDSVALARANLEMIKEDASVFCTDALSYVLSSREKFDIIFLDPPYQMNATPVLEAIAKSGILAEEGVVIYEHSENFKVGEIDCLDHLNTRKYGIAKFEFYGVKL
ncbi:MAG: 16S rRNA (guanine(966)-N(2))-methyltransferase RsmD [Clostridia bacterium]|nr:16S rRNA (guanine(966)-N(2))-methyltransferase RsmD [Clostridia bacterium]